MQNERVLPLSDLENIMFFVQDIRIEIFNALDLSAERWDLFRAFCSDRNYSTWKDVCWICKRNEDHDTFSCALCYTQMCEKCKVLDPPKCQKDRHYFCKKCVGLQRCITEVPEDPAVCRSMMFELYTSSLYRRTASTESEKYIDGIDIERYVEYIKSITPKAKKIKIERKE